MLSHLISFYNYFFPKHTEDEDDQDKDKFLSQQLIDLEVTSNDEVCNEEAVIAPAIPRSAVCFQRTGVINYIGENYVLIDGMFYCDMTTCTLQVNINDKVLYLCYKNDHDSIVVVRILENQGLHWGEKDEAEESTYNVIQHIIIGEVDQRQDRFVYMEGSDLKFSLDDVEGTFIPVKGDWLELKCTIQFDEDKPSEISAAQVLQVISFKPLRSKLRSALVTEWSGESGTCDRNIYLDRQSLQNGTMQPIVGSKVMVEAIESNQGNCSWRVIKLISIEEHSKVPASEHQLNEEQANNSFDLEREKNINLTYPLKFDNIDFQETATITISITNNSDQIYIINKWMVLNNRRDSQINIKPFLSRPMKLHPKQTFNLTATCYPKFLGHAKECLIIMFKGFQLKRFFEINVVDHNTPFKRNPSNKPNVLKTEQEKIEILRNIKRNDGKFVPGVRPIKPPAFVPVRLGMFPIPERIWSAVLGDSEQTIYGSDYNKILERIETCLPCLSQDLTVNNYIDKWHTLLYMEEIQQNICMRAHDTPKTFLIMCQEYLGIEITGLSEKRPSLINGDRVIVKDIWDTDSLPYEGFIHTIRGDLVLMKFNPRFHETYSGSDVSLEFHFNRSTYRRSHQAINFGFSNLGTDIIFPSRVMSKTPQLNPATLKSIRWFNEKLNTGQKAAVTNILMGECRPMPYCIFGPPGTGKTVTVIETILQILTNLPDSRILVATPSNSAANLITERLVQYRNSLSDSIIRLVANYLVNSDNIPETIKPFCATMDIAREDTSQSKHGVQNGVQVNCQTSYIGRHRVTIGTCYCLGTLAQMGLPKGHFTHLIVDEAGQATEPEIMIPMAFIDKANGQIILSGDPMQLGPVILSKYCIEFGMDESFMSRILETFPYQKDYNAFDNGFNNKLVTKLNDNYRSLEELLKMPSEMFYDGSLVAKINRTEAWITRTLAVVTDITNSPDSKTGGIYVYGIRGCNARAEDSPSWYNPQEASMVALMTCKLYKKDVPVEDIGIITPYIAQTKHLRLLFDAMGLPQPKIGTVEEFQGQERPIIFISTVRSNESLLKDDFKHTLGFVKNPKRLNVALTRGQVAVFLFCNPHLLGTDPLWSKVIKNAIKEDKYLGCDLPQNCKTENIV